MLHVDRLRDGKGVGVSAEQIYESYTRDIFDALDGDSARLYAAARAACLGAADEVSASGRWRAYLCAVELCQRAAGMAEDLAK